MEAWGIAEVENLYYIALNGKHPQMFPQMHQKTIDQLIPVILNL